MASTRTSGYSVVTVSGGCCSGNVSPGEISKQCNRMAQEGYELVTAYESVVGCIWCQGKAAVLIFRR
jgi:hypothetical protein